MCVAKLNKVCFAEPVNRVEPSPEEEVYEVELTKLKAQFESAARVSIVPFAISNLLHSWINLDVRGQRNIEVFDTTLSRLRHVTHFATELFTLQYHAINNQFLDGSELQYSFEKRC